MKRTLLFIFWALHSAIICFSQNYEYDERVKLDNGLYKVKSGNYYGIIDKDDNVVVSIEFQDITFNEGKALLIRENGTLYGVVNTLGHINTFENEYIVHPKYREVNEGHIIVGRKKGKAKWGYITENGDPLHIEGQTLKGIIAKGQPSMFEEASPFVNGYAAVQIKNNYWKHIDKNGKERFKLGDKKNNKAIYRSTINEGECVIVSEDGIKVYQENNNKEAVVKRVLASNATYVDFVKGNYDSKLMFKEGTLSIDFFNRVTKFRSGTRTETLIKEKVEEYKKEVIPEKKLSMKDIFSVKNLHKVVNVDENGMARTVTQIKNNTNKELKGISVTLECKGAKRSWEGSISAQKEKSLYLDIPARISTPFIKSNIIIEIKYNNEVIDYELPVTIKRYTPDR